MMVFYLNNNVAISRWESDLGIKYKMIDEQLSWCPIVGDRNDSKHASTQESELRGDYPYPIKGFQSLILMCYLYVLFIIFSTLSTLELIRYYLNFLLLSVLLKHFLIISLLLAHFLKLSQLLSCLIQIASDHIWAIQLEKEQK